MTCGVITIDFEVGYPIKGQQYGSFQGSAEVDTDGAVVSICLDSLERGVLPVTLTVPFHRATPYLGDEAFAKALAEQIQETYVDEIAFKLVDWSVSIAEKEFVREAAE